jgi:hypothetical protein
MRQAVSSRLVGVTLLVFLAIQLVVMTLQLTTQAEMGAQNDPSQRLGREVFLFVQAILVGTCILVIPAMTWGRLAAERSDVNVDLMFISSLSPRQIMAGKFAASGALSLLIFSACAPFMTFAYVLRGLDIPTVVIVLAIDFLAVQLGTMLALLVASIPANRGFRIFLGIVGVVGLIYMMLGVIAATRRSVVEGLPLAVDTWDFWLGATGVTALIIGDIGLMFVFATALISPPTANRALPVRLYMLGFWIVAGLGFGLWSVEISDPAPMLIWGIGWVAVFSLQLLIAVSERDRWGPRVARRIPRNPILRPPAFLFYSGAAGGILFGALGGGLSTLIMWGWWAYTLKYMSPFPHRADLDPTPVAAMIVGYTYCYCMSAVLFRRIFHRSGLPSLYTWLVALILFGLGCTLPHMIRFMMDERKYGYGYPDEIMWLYLPNPVVMIERELDLSYSVFGMTLVFLVAWGVMATVLNLPWLMRQVMDFRPPPLPPEVVAQTQVVHETA